MYMMSSTRRWTKLIATVVSVIAVVSITTALAQTTVYVHPGSGIYIPAYGIACSLSGGVVYRFALSNLSAVCSGLGVDVLIVYGGVDKGGVTITGVCGVNKLYIVNATEIWLMEKKYSDLLRKVHAVGDSVVKELLLQGIARSVPSISSVTVKEYGDRKELHIQILYRNETLLKTFLEKFCRKLSRLEELKRYGIDKIVIRVVPIATYSEDVLLKYRKAFSELKSHTNELRKYGVTSVALLLLDRPRIVVVSELAKAKIKDPDTLVKSLAQEVRKIIGCEPELVINLVIGGKPYVLDIEQAKRTFKTHPTTETRLTTLLPLILVILVITSVALAVYLKRHS